MQSPWGDILYHHIMACRGVERRDYSAAHKEQLNAVKYVNCLEKSVSLVPSILSPSRNPVDCMVTYSSSVSYFCDSKHFPSRISDHEQMATGNSVYSQWRSQETGCPGKLNFLL